MPDAPTDGPVVGGGRVAGNALWLTAGEAASKLASVAFVLIVARALGVREYGWFTFATAFVPLLLVVGSLGLHQAVVRDLVHFPERASETFTSGLAVRVLTGLVAVAAAAGLAPLFLPDRLAVLTVLVVGVALFLDTTTSYASAVFEVYGSLRHYAIALMVNRFGSTALALAAYAAGAGLVVVLLTYLLGSAAGTAYAARAVRRELPAVSLRDVRAATAVRLLRDGAPLGVAALLNMALLRFDTIMIAVVLGAVEVGLYGVAFRFYESFLFVAFALGDATFPRFARFGAGARSSRLVEVTTALAASAYVPLFVLSLFSAPWAIGLVVGERYLGAAPAVPWLTLAAVFFSLTYQLRNAAVGTGERRGIASIAAVALVVNVALNLVLIPRDGIAGAAFATAVAAGCEVVLTGVVLHRRGGTVRYGRVLAGPALAGLGTALALRSFGLEAGSAALAGVLLYPALLAMLLPLLPRELRATLRALLPGR